VAASDIHYSNNHFGTYSMEDNPLLDGVTVVDDTFPQYIDYDRCESEYMMSPISPSMPSLSSAISTSYSTAMSPDPITRSLSPSDAYMDDGDMLSDESDQLLDALISNIHPYRNGAGEEYFRCVDIHAPDHSCTYEDKRKCNLRY
jgi:hypothetical protein